MSDLPFRKLPERHLRFHATGKPTEAMHEFYESVHEAFKRIGRPGSGIGGGGGLGSSSLATTTEQLTGTDAGRMSTPDSVAALWEKGADVASAGTTSLGEGGFFHITGTTTITDIDFATDKAGRWACVRFTGVLILTHSATLLLPNNGSNITTAAGDRATFISEGSDIVICTSYQRADGTALSASASYTDEQARDAIGLALTAGTGISISVNDGGDTITVTATGAATGSPTGLSLHAEILADSPTGYWPCDDASGTTIVDAGGGGYDLTVTGTSTVAHSYLVPTETGLFRRFNTSTTYASRTTALGTTVPLTGDWTAMVVVTPEGLANFDALMAMEGAPADELAATNLQFFVYLANGVPTVFWEFGAGANEVVSAPTAVAAVQSHSSQMLHFVKDGTANTVTFYRNGKKISAGVASYTNEPTGGGTGTTFYLAYPSGNVAKVMGRAAFFNAAKLSDARIWAHARAGGFAGA